MYIKNLSFEGLIFLAFWGTGIAFCIWVWTEIYNWIYRYIMGILA